MKYLKQTIGKWWPTALVIAVILYATLSSDPTQGTDFPAIPHIDKLIHAIMFGGLAGAVAFDYSRSPRPHTLSRSIMAWICVGCAIAGATDEWAQSAMDNGRSAEALDLVADCAGIAVAFFTAPPAIRRVLRKKGI